MDRFIVGSRAFFMGKEGFNPKDEDILCIKDDIDSTNPYTRQVHFKNKCVFEWKRMPLEELIEINLKRNDGMVLGKFLVPEFAKEMGMKIEDLKKLKPLVNRLDDKHLYEKIIYDAYLENNEFVLNEEQRTNAYEEYRRVRNNNK